MAEHYYTVGTHGPPTKETAPHGYMWRNRHTPESKGKWVGPTNVINIAHADTEWYPLPAPPTEQAPPPEPVARWTVDESPAMTDGRLICAGNSYLPIKQAHAAADALNALDRDGVAWGPGRPMSELPDGGAVLLLDDEGAFCVLPIETVRAWSVFVCWWPLPGEAQ